MQNKIAGGHPRGMVLAPLRSDLRTLRHPGLSSSDRLHQVPQHRTSLRQPPTRPFYYHAVLLRLRFERRFFGLDLHR